MHEPSKPVGCCHQHDFHLAQAAGTADNTATNNKHMNLPSQGSCSVRLFVRTFTGEKRTLVIRKITLLSLICEHHACDFWTLPSVWNAVRGDSFVSSQRPLPI